LYQRSQIVNCLNPIHLPTALPRLEADPVVVMISRFWIVPWKVSFPSNSDGLLTALDRRLGVLETELIPWLNSEAAC